MHTVATDARIRRRAAGIIVRPVLKAVYRVWSPCTENPPLALLFWPCVPVLSRPPGHTRHSTIQLQSSEAQGVQLWQHDDSHCGLPAFTRRKADSTCPSGPKQVWSPTQTKTSVKQAGGGSQALSRTVTGIPPPPRGKT